MCDRSPVSKFLLVIACLPSYKLIVLTHVFTPYMIGRLHVNTLLGKLCSI